MKGYLRRGWMELIHKKTITDYRCENGCGSYDCYKIKPKKCSLCKGKIQKIIKSEEIFEYNTNEHPEREPNNKNNKELS